MNLPQQFLGAAFGLLVAGTQAFAPAPIRWSGSARRFVLAPQMNAGLSAKTMPAPPVKLSICDQEEHMSASVIPRFSANSDHTISWDSTDLCIEACGDKSGDAISLNRCTGGPAQSWNVLPRHDTQIQLQNTDLCADVNDARGSLHGAPVELRKCSDRVTEKWKFEEPVSLPTQTSKARVFHRFRVAGSFVSMIALAAIGIGTWFRRHLRRKPKTQVSHVAPSFHDLGGVALSDSLVAHQDGVQLTPRQLTPRVHPSMCRTAAAMVARERPAEPEDSSAPKGEDVTMSAVSAVVAPLEEAQKSSKDSQEFSGAVVSSPPDAGPATSSQSAKEQDDQAAGSAIEEAKIRPNPIRVVQSVLLDKRLRFRYWFPKAPDADWSANLSQWNLLLRLVLPDKALIVSALGTLALASAGEAYVPKLQALALNSAIKLQEGSSMDVFRQGLARLAVVSGLTTLVTGIRGYLFGIAGNRIVRRLRAKLFVSLLKQPQAFHDTRSPGELGTRFASDCVFLEDTLSIGLNIVARQLLRSILAMVILLRSNASLAGLVSTTVILRAFWTKYYIMFARKGSGARQKILAMQSQVVEQCMSLIGLVRSHSGELREASMYQTQVDALLARQKRQSILQTKGLVVNDSLDLATYVSVIGLGVWFVTAGWLPADALTTFVLYVGFVSDSARLISAQVIQGEKALGASSALFDYFDQRDLQGNIPTPDGKDDREDVRCRADTKGKRGELVFENVDFAYPSQPDRRILEGFSFSVRAGEKVAIVGGSGSGRSTVFGLAQRFYQPNSGTVKLDGVPLACLSVEQLRSKIAWVQQDPPLLLESTLRENITYGLSDVPEEKLVAAAREANAYWFIQDLPDKFETVGGSLSGGQKERIALARAFVRDPEVLLLDEPTSAQDPVSARLCLKAIDRFRKKSTILFTTHKVKEAMTADRIIVMARGKIIEQGSHEELVELGGAYAALAKKGDLVSENWAASVVDKALALDEDGNEISFLTEPERQMA